MKLEEFAEAVEAGLVPPHFPEGTGPNGSMFHDMYARYDPERTEREWKVRHAVRAKGMYALVCQAFAKEMATWLDGRRVLEVMAGIGWLARALADEGVDIIATDSYKWLVMRSNKNVYPVWRMRATTAIAKFGDDRDVLLLSWPWMDGYAAEAGRAWGPDRPIIYIGEGDGGCTADEQFYDHLHVDRRGAFGLHVWDGLHDEVFLGHYDETRAVGDDEE